MYSLVATSDISVTQVIGGKNTAKAIIWDWGGVAASVSGRMTSARANARTEIYSPASWALLKNEARKCDETVSEVPARRVKRRKRISDVLLNSICVRRMEQARKPGEYNIRNESIVDKILGVFETLWAAISSAMVVCLSVATKTPR